MKFFGKPIAVSLTAVLLAANLSMPFTSMTAFGADTDSAAESTTESAENAYADDVLNENDSEAEAENSLDEDSDRSSADAEEIAEPAESAAPGDEETAADEMTSDETSEDEMYADEDSADGSADEDISAENGGDAVSAEDVSDDNTASDDSSEEPDQDITAPALTEETSTDAVDAAQEVPEDHPDLEAEAVAEPIIPIDEICEDTDNDDVFAAYVNRELELTGDLQFDTGDLSDTSNNHEKAYASTKLSGYNRTLYAILYNEIGKVARGERTDTVFAVSKEAMGLNKYWSASDLGVSAIVENGSITSEAMNALSAKINIKFSPVLRALLLDCPYDLYWYDKTYNTYLTPSSYGATWINGEYCIYYTGSNYGTCKFPVAAEYSASGDLNTYETKAEIGTAVTTAYNKAHSIVEQYSGCTDYEKMDGYRAEICSLASYNYDAARDNSTNYGNPWQLIWVLDQDPGTTVVCEGYSKAFQYLCDLSEWNDIFRECISVVGYLRGGGHMWNIVSLRDGRSYLVDVTNCDSGMIGSDNDGHDLFLVGTGDADAPEVYCQGNIDDGYIFAQFYDEELGDLSYIYRDDQNYSTREYFDDEILTLAEGRVYADTTASGEYTGDHTHIYYNVDEVAATCQSEGHSAGGQCPICGEYDTDVEIYPAAEHTPGEWSLTKEPTYDAEGTETATCTVCGEEMTRPVDKLVSETSITLDYQELELDGNESKQLTATVLPKNAHDKSVTWRSSNTSVAAVDQSGRVTARTNGTTIITAQSAHLGLTASCTVTVKVHVQSIHVNPQGTQVVVGGTTQLYVDINPSNAYNKKYTWSSSDESIATISSSGLVTGIAPGEAMITATTQDGGLTSSCRVNVYIPVTGVTLEPASLTMNLNDTLTLTPTIIPADASNPAVTWSSSNRNIVSVGQNDGHVQARGVGTAKITVTTRDGGYKASCTITVVIPVESIELDHTELYLEPGEIETLNVTVLPDNATNKTVTWSSSDDDVASVGSDGSVTAVADGTATITATAEDGGLTASCTVTVKTPAAEPTDLAGALADGTAQVSIEDGLIYNGTAQVPEVTITYQGEPLKAGADFSVSYSNNINAGTATVIITGTGHYEGTASADFAIAKAAQSFTVKAESASIDVGRTTKVTATGAKETSKYTFSSSDTSIAEVDSSGTVTGKAEGTVTITVRTAATANYKAGSKTVKITVNEPQTINLEDNAVISSLTNRTYNGSEQFQTPVVKLQDGTVLKEGTDYTVSYENNRNAGTATVIITAVNESKYEGTASATFDIAKAAQSFTVKAESTSIDVGKTTKVAATGAKEKPKFTFTSSNAKVATVDAAGTVTGKAAGTVTITVRSAETANYKAASKIIKITVNKVLKKPGNCHFVKWNNAKYTSCRIGWVKVDGAEGYETLLSWTDGSHASRTITKSNVLYRDCTVHPQHVSQMMVRAFYTLNGIRKYSPWSNVEYITPSPTKLTVKNTSSGTNLKMNISWNIIYGCNGYNVFLTTNPNGTWYWNQSTSTTANSTSAVINKYRGSKLKKNVRYYVRIVTRRQRNGVFCTVPMPAANTYIGSFIIK